LTTGNETKITRGCFKKNNTATFFHMEVQVYVMLVVLCSYVTSHDIAQL